MTNFLYSLVLPQVLLMETLERNDFYKRTFLLTIGIGSIAVFFVYLFYRRIEKAIIKIEKGNKLSEYEFIKVEKSFTTIESFLFLVGALSYLLAIVVNVSLEYLKNGNIEIRYWIFRTILAVFYGLLNGIVVARLINYAWIDAKHALNIRYLKDEKHKSKTRSKLIIPSILLLFVNISFLTVATFNFFDRYAFTYIKFNFILKHFLSLAIRFIIVDLIVFYSIFLEHQKHIDHLYNQFDIMANQEMDLSKRVNIVSFDEIGKMISNINIILDKLQDSFLQVANAEKIVSDLSLKIEENFLALKDESLILSKIIKDVQNIEDNENKVVEKTNIDFKNLIITIENTVSKYKYQNNFIEQTSVSMKNILSSFQFISRLTIETSQLFESLASN
ncbi:MAG: methyl-accepting chemotaxis protein, partial [Spirochaetales bacterium]|nr:methyl-accepting chemotaxis protein [Spirochaetales bacterium]